MKNFNNHRTIPLLYDPWSSAAQCWPQPSPDYWQTHRDWTVFLLSRSTVKEESVHKHPNNWTDRWMLSPSFSVHNKKWKLSAIKEKRLDNCEASKEGDSCTRRERSQYQAVWQRNIFHEWWNEGVNFPQSYHCKIIHCSRINVIGSSRQICLMESMGKLAPLMS